MKLLFTGINIHYTNIYVLIREIMLFLVTNLCFFYKASHQGKVCYKEKRVCSILESLINNLSVKFRGAMFPQQVGISIATHFIPVLADGFLYSYEKDLFQNFEKNENIKDVTALNFTYR